MWQLYKLLGKGLGKSILLDEIVLMLQTIHPENVKASLRLMYGEKVRLDNPLEIGLIFTKGLKQNRFFEFQLFVDTINHGRS